MNKMKMIAILTFLLVYGCSGVKLINYRESTDFYSKDFLTQIDSIKKEYSSNPQKRDYIQTLQSIDDTQLLLAEKAFKYNLIGVIYFKRGDISDAKHHFDTALKIPHSDEILKSQIILNYASSLYKLNQFQEAYSSLKNINTNHLRKNEKSKFYHLKFVLAHHFEHQGVALESLIKYLDKYQKLSELLQDSASSKLLEISNRLAPELRMEILNKFEDDKHLGATYLGIKEAERHFLIGQKEKAINVIEWLTNSFHMTQELKKKIDSLQKRIANFSKIDPYTIGVVLPLSGNKEKFAKRALLGIDVAFKKLGHFEGDRKYKLLIEDSYGNGIVGAQKMSKLIKKHNTSLIIGGLFPDEALKEYLEAKKYGILFISLSQIYLPKSEKSHLLFEIPGSVESQINTLFSEKILSNFGSKGAIIYPETTRGRSFIDEFWRQSNLKGLDISSVQSFPRNSMDYRDPVKRLLGLKFTREREEELKLWTKIYSLDKHRQMRRLQKLKPLQTFDWVYLPLFPNQVLQVVPAFKFYDAKKITFFGVPSWGMSKSLAKQSRKLGALHFLTDINNKETRRFRIAFSKLYGTSPRLIETLAYKGMDLAHKLLTKTSFSTRDEFNLMIQSLEDLENSSGVWKQVDNIWIKEMSLLKLRRGRIEQVEELQVMKNNEPDVLEKTN